MPKYKLKTLLLLSTLPLILTACTLQDLPVIGKFFGGKGAKADLVMWGLWEADSTYAAVLKKYQTEFPNVNLDYQDMSVLKLNGLVEYKSRVFTRLAEADWDADIVMVHNSWVSRLVAADLLEPMPETLMTPDTYAQTFYPAATEAAVSGGQIYAVPAYYDGLVLVYNKDHFAEIGQVSPPTAWEEFRRVAIELRKVTEGDNPELIRGGAAIGAADNIGHFSDILGLMWAQAGVQIPEGIDSVQAQDAFSFYISLMKDHGVWREDFPEATTAFVNGQVSMIFVPSWQILDILVANPGMNIGVAPVPQALANNPATWGSFWMYVVPKNSDAKTPAWNFINFLATESSQQDLFREASKVREFGTPYGLASMATELLGDPFLGPVIQTAPFATSGEIAARSGNRLQEEALKKAIDDYLSDTTRTITVAEVLSEAKATMMSVQ